MARSSNNRFGARRRQAEDAYASRADAAGSSAAQHTARRRSSSRSNTKDYANDNSIVQAVYDFTAGRGKPVFLAIVGVAAALSIYFPVRDYYIAQRSSQILQEQQKIRDSYSQQLENDVNALLSEEGIEETARKSYGLVNQGESTIDVQGLDELLSVEKEAEEVKNQSGNDAPVSNPDSILGSTDDASADGDPSADDGPGASDDDSSEAEETRPTTSTELEAAIAAVGQDAPWYTKLFDAFFFFGGVDNQSVQSTGE